MQLTALINQLDEDDYKTVLMEFEDNGMLDSEDFQDRSRFLDELNN